MGPSEIGFWRNRHTGPDPEYQEEFSIPWKRNGERKRIRFRGWSGNDAIYHLNRGRRETMISVPLGVLLLHSRRGPASIIGGHRLNCASLPPPINHPQPAKQTNNRLPSRKRKSLRYDHASSRKLERTRFFTLLLFDTFSRSLQGK